MYSTIIQGTHLFLPKDELRRPLDELREEFTIRSRYQGVSPVKVYVEDAQYFGVPRHYSKGVLKGAESVIDKTVYSEQGQNLFVYTATLRLDQHSVFEEVKDAVKNGETGFLISMETGSGKTHVLLKIAEYFARPVLVIVPLKSLLEQWKERIIEHTDITPEEIGIVQAGKCDYKGKKVVLGMIHSVCKDKYGEDFKNHFSVIMWDEIHKSSAYTFSKTVCMFPAKYRLGCSASMHRKDGLTNVYKWHVGGVTIKPSVKSVRLKPLAISRRYSTDHVEGRVRYIAQKINRRGAIISALARDTVRTSMIADSAVKLVRSGRRTLLLSDRIVQLDDIQREAIRLGIKSGQVGIFINSTPKTKQDYILRHCSLILATYGMFALGMDVPDLAGLVLGTPHSDVKQPVGRIMREHEGKGNPVIVDIVDVKYRDCLFWHKARVKQYETMQAEQQTLRSDGSIVR